MILLKEYKIKILFHFKMILTMWKINYMIKLKILFMKWKTDHLIKRKMKFNMIYQLIRVMLRQIKNIIITLTVLNKYNNNKINLRQAFHYQIEIIPNKFINNNHNNHGS